MGFFSKLFSFTSSNVYQFINKYLGNSFVFQGWIVFNKIEIPLNGRFFKTESSIFYSYILSFFNK